MERRLGRLAVLPPLLLLAACGYVGDPQPPALRIPREASGLSAKQRGARVLVEFTLPSLTTEGQRLDSIREIDLRGGPGGVPFDWDSWAANARRIPAGIPREGPVRAETPADGWVGSEVIFAVRVAGAAGRFSRWSDPVVLEVVPPLAAPSIERAEPTAAGVRLNWRAVERPGQEFRVYRRAENEERAAEVARVAAFEWVDAGAAAGAAYEYSVQAVLKAGQGEAESELSPARAVSVQDRFPPAKPSGLTAIAGQQSIELLWDRNTEPDLRAYRVYRARGQGEFELVAGEVEVPAFSDRGAQPGDRYRYAVTAVDAAGNESERSDPAEAELR